MANARTIDVGPDRLERWLAGFAERHGPTRFEALDDALRCVGADGAVAVVTSAFPPLPTNWADADPARAFVAHACASRVIALVLVRLGGYAAGVFDGDQALATKVGARQVHGRSSAGGWSQQRFARRREGQVKVALETATDNAVTVVLPFLHRIDAVVTGGDRQALRAVLADRRLDALRPLVVPRILDVPDPKARVLHASIAAARAVTITLSDDA
ncbi:MAG TPA: acVLRF1 family peptidyl-tRNA hydrolase [Acidothermaceae bacterium]